MMGRKDMKQETMAKRSRNRAMSEKMMSPRKKMGMGMSPGPEMGPASAPSMPMGMKKGGEVRPVKKSEIVGRGPTKAAAKADYGKEMKAAGFAKGGMAKKGMKGGGMMLVIGLGKKKGK
jgi:hypothetical protein